MLLLVFCFLFYWNVDAGEFTCTSLEQLPVFLLYSPIVRCVENVFVHLDLFRCKKVAQRGFPGFPERISRLPREVVDSPALEVFKPRLVGALNNLV